MNSCCVTSTTSTTTTTTTTQGDFLPVRHFKHTVLTLRIRICAGKVCPDASGAQMKNEMNNAARKQKKPQKLRLLFRFCFDCALEKPRRKSREIARVGGWGTLLGALSFTRLNLAFILISCFTVKGSVGTVSRLQVALRSAPESLVQTCCECEGKLCSFLMLTYYFLYLCISTHYQQ